MTTTASLRSLERFRVSWVIHSFCWLFFLPSTVSAAWFMALLMHCQASSGVGLTKGGVGGTRYSGGGGLDQPGWDTDSGPGIPAACSHGGGRGVALGGMSL